MGYFDFTSRQASVLWKQTDAWFPDGKWVDVNPGPGSFSRRPLGADLATSWRKAFEKLLQTAKNFMGDRSYHEDDASALKRSILEKLDAWSNPGNWRKEDIVAALGRDMGLLINALPDLSQLRKSDPDQLRPGVKEAIESFTDTSVSILKLFAVDLENSARQQTKDRDLNWQNYAATLALIKFKDTASTIREWTGDLPTALCIAPDEPSSGAYFKAIVENIEDVDTVSPVTQLALKENLDILEHFAEGMNDPTERVSQLSELARATGMLEKLGSTLVSDKVQSDDKVNTAWETMVYLDCLKDVFGEKRVGNEKLGFDERAHLSTEKIEKFTEAARTAVSEIDRTDREERWELR